MGANQSNPVEAANEHEADTSTAPSQNGKC